jgi:hypothetical protein
MLSSNLVITAGQYGSTTSTVDTNHDDVATNDIVRIDTDTAGTGTKGLIVSLIFAPVPSAGAGSPPME